MYLVFGDNVWKDSKQAGPITAEEGWSDPGFL
jgi:hypothetical protein